MPTRIIYKRRKEKEKRLAQLLLIATAVLAIGGAGIAACFTAIGHVDAVQRSGLGTRIHLEKVVPARGIRLGCARSGFYLS